MVNPKRIPLSVARQRDDCAPGVYRERNRNITELSWQEKTLCYHYTWKIRLGRSNVNEKKDTESNRYALLRFRYRHHFKTIGSIHNKLRRNILPNGDLDSDRDTDIPIQQNRQKRDAECFPVFMGMLVTYYAVAALSQGVYSKAYIIGWTVFALCSPVFAYAAWHAKGKGILSRIIGAAIVAVSILSSVVLFDRLRIYDIIIDGLLIYFLFIKKIDR